MANQFGWSLGHEGKGNVYDDGSISTWNTRNASPHHYEVGQRDEKIPRFHFYISPEGGLWDGGTTFNNQTPHTDDQVVANIVAQHSAIWDGRHELGEDLGSDWAPEGRVEMPGGGFGHADALLHMTHKLASSGWADFHTEFKIPRGVRKQIRRWVDRLKWPEGSEKIDAREYHITVLDMDKYDEDFAKWARKRVQGKTLAFKSQSMDMFNEFVVVRLECPVWDEIARDWTEEAEKRGLEPHTFPGGPKAHISVGKSPNGKWPQGIPNPHVKFETRMFNIKRNSMWHEAMPYYPGWEEKYEPEDASHLLGGSHDFYHYAPTTERNRILQHGLQVSLPEHSDHWTPGEVSEQPQGVYVTTEPNQMHLWSRPMDLWKIPNEQITELEEDPLLAHAYLVPHDVQPELLEPYENSLDWEERQQQRHGFPWSEPHEYDSIELPPSNYEAVPVLSGREAKAGDPWQPGVWGKGLVYDEKPVMWETNSPHEGQMEPNHPDFGWENYERYPSRENAPIVISPSGTYVPAPHWEISERLEKGHPDPLIQKELDALDQRLDIYKQHPNMKRISPAEWEQEMNKDSVPYEGYGHAQNILDSLQRQGKLASVEPVDDLARWLDSFTVDQEAPPSLHHTDGDDFMPQVITPVVTTPHVDPPKKPYKPYNWAEEGWEESPLNRVAGIEDHTCPQCGSDIDAPICAVCGYDPQDTSSEYKKMKQDWYDRAWSRPGDQPQPVPHQPHHWRDDHAKDISLASVSGGWHGF